MGKAPGVCVCLDRNGCCCTGRAERRPRRWGGGGQVTGDRKPPFLGPETPVCLFIHLVARRNFETPGRLRGRIPLSYFLMKGDFFRSTETIRGKKDEEGGGPELGPDACQSLHWGAGAGPPECPSAGNPSHSHPRHTHQPAPPLGSGKAHGVLVGPGRGWRQPSPSRGSSRGHPSAATGPVSPPGAVTALR